MKQVARWMMSGDKWEETMREKMDDEVGGDDDDVGKLMMWLLLLGPRSRWVKPAEWDESRDDDEEALKDGDGRREAERSMMEFIKKNEEEEQTSHRTKTTRKMKEYKQKCFKERRLWGKNKLNAIAWAQLLSIPSMDFLIFFFFSPQPISIKIRFFLLEKYKICNTH